MSHLFHVLDDLLVAVLQTANAVLARVISGYSKPHIAVVLAQQMLQIPDAAAYVLLHVEGVRHSEP